VCCRFHTVSIAGRELGRRKVYDAGDVAAMESGDPRALLFAIWLRGRQVPRSAQAQTAREILL